VRVKRVTPTRFDCDPQESLPARSGPIALLDSRGHGMCPEKDRLLTGKIVLAHLKEMLDYYLRLRVAELEGDMFKALVAGDTAEVAASYSRVIEAREELVRSESQARTHHA
jgi:hypothetical protein